MSNKKVRWLSGLLAIMALAVGSCAGEPEIEIPDSFAGLENLTVYPGHDEPGTSIELVRKRAYGDVGDVILGTVAGIYADNRGRVYVTDEDANAIHVYRPDGSYLTRIGREGRGPGEFMAVRNTRIGNHAIHLFDYAQQRMNVVPLDSLDSIQTTAFQFWEDEKVDMSGWHPLLFFVQDDGNYLFLFSRSIFDTTGEEHIQRLFSVSSDGQLLTHIVDVPRRDWLLDSSGRRGLAVNYGRKPILNLSGGAIYKIWTEHLMVRRYDLQGRYQSAFYHPVHKSNLSGHEILETYGGSHELIRNATLPKTWPAVQDFLMDDEHRHWISVIVDDRDIYEWWLLKEDGELITRFIWPADNSIHYVRNGYLYALETDEETGAQEVVKYRIDLN